MLFKISSDIKTTVVDPNKKSFGTYWSLQKFTNFKNLKIWNLKIGNERKRKVVDNDN